VFRAKRQTWKGGILMEQKTLRKASGQRGQTPDLTGIPMQMKLDFEKRSGLPLDDVRVHYSSDKPDKIGALAYTQGTQVYIGPGQTRHLGHELGHVVQQKLGMVRPTGQVNGLPLNDSPELERAADSGYIAYGPSRRAPSNLVQRQLRVALSLYPAPEEQRENPERKYTEDQLEVETC